jgi:hypothetical protein
VSVLESMGSGHNRELTRERKLHPATVASMRLQNAILGPQSAEFNDHCCQQAESLVDAPCEPNFRSSDVCSSNPEVHFVLLTGSPFAAGDYAEWSFHRSVDGAFELPFAMHNPGAQALSSYHFLVGPSHLLINGDGGF